MIEKVTFDGAPIDTTHWTSGVSHCKTEMLSAAEFADMDTSCWREADNMIPPTGETVLIEDHGEYRVGKIFGYNSDTNHTWYCQKVGPYGIADTYWMKIPPTVTGPNFRKKRKS